MATFFVLNHKKYRTSVRCADGRLEAVRFEPEVYFGGVGESTYTTSDPAIIDALHEHPAYQVTFWLQANLDYVVPAGMKKDDIKIEAAKRNILFINW